jgi:hypothetical protein
LKNLEETIMTIEPDTALGVSIMLTQLLDPGWQHKLENGGFTVTPPASLQNSPSLRNIVHTQAWKISSGLAYWHFSSLTETADGGFRLDTRMESGAGYFINFVLK